MHYAPMRARIDAALGELEAKLGGLLVEADAPDAEVLVRGQVAAKLPLVTPIFLAPGDVAVVVRAPGKVATTIRAHVAIGEVARAGATLPALAVGTLGLGAPAVSGLGALAAPGLGVPTAAVAAPVASVWPLVLGIGGGVVMTGAIISSIVAANLRASFDATLCGGSGASPECPSIQSGLNVTTGLQVGGYLLGSVAITAGIVVFAVTRSVPSLDCPPAVGRREPAVLVQCGPRLGGDGAGLGCAGVF